ncbi:hypothetical protein HII31_11114 [Pseudocercospora fuligena]|uniref:Uncharacterized protein n=1 Tax=Pseudocercospora fuligena TaxID=685502 RepID=A0A8H6VI14_9PEZI|nr:hypothetical protein HII31_11114 [Pseudocercospora fuligena]
MYGHKSDKWAVSTQSTPVGNGGLLYQAVDLAFVSNLTRPYREYESMEPQWIPSRQLLWTFTLDRTFFDSVQKGAHGADELNEEENDPTALISPDLADQYDLWTKALQLRTSRLGPVLSIISRLWPP